MQGLYSSVEMKLVLLNLNLFLLTNRLCSEF